MVSYLLIGPLRIAPSTINTKSLLTKSFACNRYISEILRVEVPFYLLAFDRLKKVMDLWNFFLSEEEQTVFVESCFLYRLLQTRELIITSSYNI